MADGETTTVDASDVLIAAGRRANTDRLGLERTAVETDEEGFIEVDEQFRTAEDGIYALGDVTGMPMVTHSARDDADLLYRHLVEDEQVDATVPDGPLEMERVVREVFGIGDTELDVCRSVMVDGESTVRELADRLGRDRTVVFRHVNHLVDLGLLEKELRVLSGGGRVNVFSPVPEEVVRRQLKLGLYAWFVEAETAVDELSREKIQAMAREQTAEPIDERKEPDGNDRSLIDRLLS